jgi:3-deoxy-manno-octulosonate cytidylyltransferase (CMP-KDO synthetase)
MKVIGIIPSRYASSRFPGKPLADILGKSMIQRVYEQCKKCSLLSEVIVATDDKRIYNHVLGFNGKAMMTSKTHDSGTDRCNEVAQKLYANYDLVVNIQGDEPFIHPEQINQIASLFSSSEITIATLAKEIKNPSLLIDINNPKAIFNNHGIALTFCRSIAKINPKQTYYKHIGIYAYRTQILAKICKLPPSKNEKAERLEQLRWIDNGYKIKIGITTFESLSADTPEDIEKIKAQMG